MLKRIVRPVIGMAGQMNLAVFADDCAFLVDQNRRVVVMGLAALPLKLGVAQIKSYAERLGGLEQRPGCRARNLPFEEAVDLGIVLHPPARKEGRQRQLWVDHDVGAARLGLFHQFEQPRNDLLPRFIAGDRSELSARDTDMPSHLPASQLLRLAARACRSRPVAWVSTSKRSVITTP